MSMNVIKKIGKACFHLMKKDKRPFTSAIILAAGKGERMKSEGVSKQLMEIEGKPVVVHTLLAFQKSRHVDEIIVVGAESELELYKEFKKTYKIGKLKMAVGGGSCRAVSAQHGFISVSDECGNIVIHDAARCLITTEDIDRVIKEVYRTGAAIVAKKATDTIKKTDSHGFITETVDRSSLWLAQTPQAFKKSVYEVSLAKANILDASVTDDAMLVSNAGFRVKIVECHHENIKITTPEDLPIATMILEKRRQIKENKKGNEEK